MSHDKSAELTNEGGRWIHDDDATIIALIVTALLNLLRDHFGGNPTQFPVNNYKRSKSEHPSANVS